MALTICSSRRLAARLNSNVRLHKPTMSPENLLSELWAYAHTKEYREGLFVEASGLVLDVLLLIIGVKVIAYYLARQSRSTTSFASSFFIAQFLREVLSLQLKSGGVAEINASLNAAFERRELESLFSHFLYGNTVNLMDLLRLRMKSGEHIVGHRSLTAEQRKDLSKEAQALMGRLDNLLVILASLRQEDQCLRAFEFRLVLTAVSDYLEDLSDSDLAPPPRTYAPMSTALASAVENWFQPCKRALDRQYKGQIRWVTKASKKRGEELRRQYNISDDSPLKSRDLRNAIEHFDERLDQYFSGAVVGTIIPHYIGSEPPPSQVKCHFFRAYFMDTGVFELLGHRYHIEPLSRELWRIEGGDVST